MQVLAKPTWGTFRSGGYGRRESVQDGRRSQEAGLDLAMDRYAQGEEAAFAEVYDELSPRLYGYLMRQTRSRERISWRAPR